MVDVTTQFIVDLFLLLGTSVVAGEVASRLGQAALVGQLLAGLALGPTLLGPYLNLNSVTPELSSLQLLATIFILFMAGLDIVPEQIYRMGAGNFLLGLAIFGIPFLVLSLLSGVILPGLHYPTTLYVALTLSITALPVMGILLREFGLIGSRLGTLLMNASLVNEFTAVTVFAILLRLGPSPVSNLIGLGIAALSVGVFLGTILSIHSMIRTLQSSRLWDRLRQRFAESWRGRQGNFAVLMVMVIGSTLFAQFLGLTYVVGAFFAGLLVTRESAGQEAHAGISRIFDAMTWGFFVPLFFALVGLSANARLLLSVGAALAFGILLVLGMVTKILTGRALGGWLGWKNADAWALGHLVNARGAVELAMAVTLLQLHLIDTNLFTIVALVGLITTMAAPIGAQRAWRKDPRAREDLQNRLRQARPAAGLKTDPPIDWEEIQRRGRVGYFSWEPPRPPSNSPLAPDTPTSGGESSDRPPLPRTRRDP
jgi:Kef-type K+ transport system membrane component KefB